MENNDVYKNIERQKRKSILFTVALVLLLVFMAAVSVYFIVFDNIDSFLNRFQNNDIQYETISDDMGFTYRIRNNVARLVEYAGTDTVVEIPAKINDADVVYIEGFNNENVVEITIPPTVLYIEDRAFYHLKNLKTVKGCEMVADIGEDVFKGCTALENYAFTNNLITIDKEAFCNTNLKSVTLPANIRDLNKRVFNSCRNLQEITIGAGVIFIGDQCFKNCEKLEKVTCYGGTMNFGDEIFTNCSKDLIVYCSSESNMSSHCSVIGIKTQEISQ